MKVLLAYAFIKYSYAMPELHGNAFRPHIQIYLFL